jgi:hypothetical protein
MVAIHAASTLMMAGAAWFIQLVHYPLFPLVGTAQFAAYESRNVTLTTWTLGPLMAIEAVTALLLLWRRPAPVSARAAWIGFSLLAAIWLSTFLWQYPLHLALRSGFDEGIYAELVASNWIRTIGWSLRVGVVLTMLGKFDRVPSA